MEQDVHKPRSSWLRRIGCMIGAFIVLSLALCIILTLLGPYFLIDLYPNPIVTPAYSAQELWDNPLPLPEWITWVSNYGRCPLCAEDFGFCLDVDLSPIWDWEVSDAGKLNTGIAVDGMAISRRDIFLSYLLGPAIWCEGVLNSPANRDFLIAEAGPAPGYALDVVDDCRFIHGPNHICFYTPPLEPGLHTATIRIENNAGVPYTYEWAFRVR